MAKTPGKRRLKGEGRVGFLARVEEIRTLIDQGYPLLSIYERHKDGLTITYSQFTRYVAKFITRKEAHGQAESAGGTQAPGPKPSAPAGQQPAGAKPAGPGPAAAGTPAPSRTGFKHDAAGAKERDDLI